MAVKFTDRQAKIISLIDCGADAEEIADELEMSTWTLRDQIRRMRLKVGAAKMTDLPACARRHGLTLPECEE